MSVISITNANPKIIQPGVRDDSVEKVAPQIQSAPIHTPIIWINASSGKTNTAVLCMDSGDAQRIYGQDIFNLHGKYFNHASKLAEIVLSAGNPVFLKRMTRGTVVTAGHFVNGATYTITGLGNTTQQQWTTAGVSGTAAVGTVFTAAGAGVGTGTVVTNLPKTSNLVLMAELDSTTPVHPYKRDSSGNIIYDSTTGDPTFDTSATVLNGITVKFSTQPMGTLTDVQLNGPLTVGGKTLYPLWSTVGPYEGSVGDSYGWRFWTASPDSLAPGDNDVVLDQQALIFNAQLVSTVSSSTPNVVPDINGVVTMPFMFKPNAYNYKSNSDMSIQGLVKNWSDDGSVNGTAPTYSNIGKVTVYEQNLETVLNILLAAENANIPNTQSPVPSIWMLDFLSGLNNNNGSMSYPAYGFQVDAAGALINQNYSFFMTGGNDGDLTDVSYEQALVDETLNHYNDPDYPLVDEAKYPFSAIYDSGVSVATKKVLFNWLNYRQDVHVTVGTYISGEDPISLDTEISRLIDLHTTAMNYAESSEYGTNAFRAVIMGQSGNIINDTYKKSVSTVFNLAKKRAVYFGAADGKAKPGQAYNNPPNLVDMLSDLSTTYQSPISRNTIWTGGGNLARSFDMRSYFWPMIQTVYGIDGSVLVDETFMQIVVDVKKQTFRVWTLMAGTDDLSDSQFALKANNTLKQLTDGKYDGKATIIPNCFYRPDDTARGYTWVMGVTVAGNVGKTVQVVELNTVRKSSLPTTNG